MRTLFATRWPRAIVQLGIIAVLASVPVASSAQSTTRISVAPGGLQADWSSYNPSISADGRWVAFESIATNLVAGDTNAHQDVFVHDRTTGATTRVSVGPGGIQGNGSSWQPSISADGRWVAFESYASNLVPGDTNWAGDVFVHDRQTGTTRRVSLGPAGVQSNNHCSSASISADGRFVAFWSYATNLISGASNIYADVFVHDLHTSTTTVVSDGLSGPGDGNSGPGNNYRGPSISADGRWVAFQSWASNLVVGDNNLSRDIFVHDRDANATTRVSVGLGGAESNWHSTEPAISADGRWVAFASWASNLVAGDTNNASDIFAYDRQTGITIRANVGPGGVEANTLTENHLALSADGRWLAFRSHATNLVPNDTNGWPDIFVRDLQAGVTSRVNVGPGGVAAQGDSGIAPSISADGRFVAFESSANNLVLGDTGHADVFVRDQGDTGCALFVVPQVKSVPGAGGSGAVVVLGSDGCGWTAASNDPSWLSITWGAAGTGVGVVTYTAAANPTAAPRVGTMTVGGQTVTVTQSLSIPSVPSLPVPADGAVLTTHPLALDWADAGSATSYDVYLDGSLRGTVLTSNWTLNQTLLPGPHTWQVVARNAAGAVSGATWTFAIGGSSITFAVERFNSGVREVLTAFVARTDRPNEPIDPLARTWLVIHGRGSSSEQQGIAGLASAIRTVRPADQVLVLDWRNGAAASGARDFAGEDWIQPVAAATAATLAAYGLEGRNLHFVGHSWGANLADELAERTPYALGSGDRRVATIVALDAARESLPPLNGGAYNAEAPGQIDFGAHSDCSWAFRSSFLGSPVTPVTADESVFMEFRLPTLPDLSHSLAPIAFSAMVQDVGGSTGRYFQLDRLTSCRPGPWRTNRFDADGDRSVFGRYEAVVHAPDGVLSWVDFDGTSPTNLRVLSVAGNAVRLAWSLPAAGGSLAGIQLEGGLTPGAVVGSVMLSPLPEATLTLPSGTLYLRVRALAGGALSDTSNEISVKVGVPAPPAAPVSLLGLANGTDLSLLWKNSFSGGVPASAILNVSGAVNAALPLGNTESFKFSGVPPGTYTFSVIAQNGSGTSAASNSVTLTFPSACSGVPQKVSNFVALWSGGTVFLTWDPPGSGAAPSGYIVTVTGAIAAAVPTGATTLSGVVPPGTYSLSVSAVNACGVGVATPSQTVVVP